MISFGGRKPSEARLGVILDKGKGDPAMTLIDADKSDRGEERDGETYAVIGAAMAVYNELGAGFVEKVYQEALAVELTARAIAFVREKGLSIQYRGERLPLEFRADFVCFGAIIVELKAIARLTPIETAQVLNYLKAARLSRALLINFGAQRLEYRRLVLTQEKPADPIK